MGDGGGDRQLNVFGAPLEVCCKKPMTGFYRDGYCNTGPMDTGTHTVCAHMTEEFLAFSARAGNDLSTPRPEYDFPGLQPGDRWCLCARRWQEAEMAGCLANCFFGGIKKTCVRWCLTLFQLLSAVSRVLLEMHLCGRAWRLCGM
jgi:uncharacterized protein (DUF2237 family)